jgi:plasmid stabilization system protein ParE
MTRNSLRDIEKTADYLAVNTLVFHGRKMGMKREQANEIALKLLATYEDQAATASMGKEYQECYDVYKALPIQEHYDMYRKVKDEISDKDLLFRPREVSYKNHSTKR